MPPRCRHSLFGRRRASYCDARCCAEAAALLRLSRDISREAGRFHSALWYGFAVSDAGARYSSLSTVSMIDTDFLTGYYQLSIRLVFQTLTAAACRSYAAQPRDDCQMRMIRCRADALRRAFAFAFASRMLSAPRRDCHATDYTIADSFRFSSSRISSTAPSFLSRIRQPISQIGCIDAQNGISLSFAIFRCRFRFIFSDLRL